MACLPPSLCVWPGLLCFALLCRALPTLQLAIPAVHFCAFCLQGNHCVAKGCHVGFQECLQERRKPKLKLPGWVCASDRASSPFNHIHLALPCASLLKRSLFCIKGQGCCSILLAPLCMCKSTFRMTAIASNLKEPHNPSTFHCSCKGKSNFGEQRGAVMDFPEYCACFASSLFLVRKRYNCVCLYLLQEAHKRVQNLQRLALSQLGPKQFKQNVTGRQLPPGGVQKLYVCLKQAPERVCQWPNHK